MRNTTRFHRSLAFALLALSVTVLLAVAPIPVHAQSTLVQQAAGGCDSTCYGSSQVQVSFVSGVASGDVIVVGVVAEDDMVSSVGDSYNPSFTPAVFAQNAPPTGVLYVYIYYATLSQSQSGPDTVTVTFASGSPGSFPQDVYIYEVSGVTTTGFMTGTGWGNPGTPPACCSTSSVAYSSGAFLLGMIFDFVGAPLCSAKVTAGSPDFTLSPTNPPSTSGCGYAQYSTSAVTNPTTFPATSSSLARSTTWVEAGIALEPSVTTVSTTVPSTVVSTTFTTSSVSTTTTFSTIAGSTTTTVLEPPLITNTLVTTVTTTGPVAGTYTTTFTSPLSTSYSTDTAPYTTVSTTEITTQTGTTTTGTLQSETTTSTGTSLSTTTTGGTVSVSETDTFNILLTQIYQELEQWADEFLQFLGFQVTATPVGQQVNQVWVTVTSTSPTVTTSTTSVTVTSFTVSTSSVSATTTITVPATFTSVVTTTQSPLITGTVYTTVTSTGLVAGTFTVTSTQILSTSTSTSTATVSTFRTVPKTLIELSFTYTSTVTAKSTAFQTTTSNGMAQVTQTDIFTKLITFIVQLMYQLVTKIIETFQVVDRIIKTPIGRVVHRVIKVVT